jgi:hypothetical protein
MKGAPIADGVQLKVMAAEVIVIPRERSAGKIVHYRGTFIDIRTAPEMRIEGSWPSFVHPILRVDPL